MVKAIQVFLFVLICLSSGIVHAKGERYGISVNLLNIESMSYDLGDTSEVDSVNFGIQHTRPIDEDNNRWRWLFSFNYIDESIDAVPNGIYQEAKSYQLRIVPQYALMSWNSLTPYVGVGFSFAFSEYSNRWLVDDEVYRYGTKLDDINQFELGLVASIGTVIKLGSNPDAHLQIVPQASYIFPVYGEGLGGVELTLAISF